MPEPPDHAGRPLGEPFPWVRAAHESLNQPFQQLLRAMALCVEHQLHTPTLVLLYSAIDTAAWLGAEEPPGIVRERFVRWVDRYVVAALTPPRCTAVELYAARCGVVHTMTATSNLTGRGVRKVIYAWLPSRRVELAEMTAIGNMSADHVAVQGDELISAFADGLNLVLPQFRGHLG